MNPNSPYDNAADASAGAIPEVWANAGVLLLCGALITLAVTAMLLLLTLPGALDAVAGSTPVIDVDATRIDERYTGQVVADWVDTLD